jgi:hypothetical protein
MTQPGTNGLQWIVIGTKEVFFPSGDEKERKVVKAGVEKENKKQGKRNRGKKANNIMDRRGSTGVADWQLWCQRSQSGANWTKVDKS